MSDEDPQGSDLNSDYQSTNGNSSSRTASLWEKTQAMMKERQDCDNQQRREEEKHARCALLPSPEMLDFGMISGGLDRTNTLGDVKLVFDWTRKADLLNTVFYDKVQNKLGMPHAHVWDTADFDSWFRIAFHDAFYPMRNTASPELNELVFWYYAGHGLGKEKAKSLNYCSTPHTPMIKEMYYTTTKEFLKFDRKVKGGELCLNNLGFCDLHGLLKPWIAAVKEKSECGGGPKKNKHLVIILDSCHSGIIAQELNEFKEQVKHKDLLDQNTVTIQAACGPDERTQGGYFTPCFVYLNDPQHKELSDKLKVEWEKMSEESKQEYRSAELPSPMVVTTRDQPQGAVTMEMEVQNFKLTLFPDPGFFKFCTFRVYQDQDAYAIASLGQDRVLNPSAFMASRPFTVLDYKLKTFRGNGSKDPNAGTPMGLFLLDDPNNSCDSSLPPHKRIKYAVCAHIHFKRGDTSKPQRINLVHHKAPPMGSVLYTEDHPATKIDCTADPNAAPLVQACRAEVDKQELGRWGDVARWNMRSSRSRKFR